MGEWTANERLRDWKKTEGCDRLSERFMDVLWDCEAERWSM